MKFKIDENLPILPSQYSGLIVLRLKQHDKIHVLSIFSRVMDLLETEQVGGRLWVIEESRIRIRE